MVWLVIVAILLVAVGPVLYVIPSKRDKQLIALRTLARKSGLTIQISHLPDLNAKGRDKVSSGGKKRQATIKCATYTLGLAKPLPDAPVWHLARSEKDNVLIPGWGRIGSVHGISISDRVYWAKVRTIIAALPGACIAVRATPYGMSWQGLERLDEQPIDQVIADIKTGLEKLIELHTQIDNEHQLSCSDP